MWIDSEQSTIHVLIITKRVVHLGVDKGGYCSYIKKYTEIWSLALGRYGGVMDKTSTSQRRVPRFESHLRHHISECKLALNHADDAYQTETLTNISVSFYLRKPLFIFTRTL